MNLPDLPVSKIMEKGLEKPATTGGRVINALLLAAFSPLLKYEVRKEAEIESYKQKILNEISKIPEDKLIDPPLNVVGPALDVAKFYIDSDELKTMFSKLIASSMNSDTQFSSHPSFVEIIKQLSSFDALVLKELSKQNCHPIISYRLDQTEYSSFGVVGIMVVNNLVKLDCINFENAGLLSPTIDNLVRLNLVDITYDSQLADNHLYDDTISTFDNSVKKHVEKYFYCDEKFRNRKLNILYGILEFTTFGLNFVASCIS